jgi:hypothetical protein
MKEKKYRYNVPATVIFDVVAVSRKEANAIAKLFALHWDRHGVQITLYNTPFERVFPAVSEDVEPNFHHIQPEEKK